MKKTDRTFGRIKKLAATLLTLVMLLSAVTPVYAAKNDDGINTTAESVQAEENYNGFPIENGYLKRDDTSSILFRYSDGFFVTDPIKYDPHLATMSQVMALAYSAVGIICSPSYIIAEGECHIIGADRVYFRAHAATDQAGTFIQLFPVSKNELSVKADRKCLSAVKLYICCMI